MATTSAPESPIDWRYRIAVAGGPPSNPFFEQYSGDSNILVYRSLERLPVREPLAGVEHTSYVGKFLIRGVDTMSVVDFLAQIREGIRGLEANLGKPKGNI